MNSAPNFSIWCLFPFSILNPPTSHFPWLTDCPKWGRLSLSSFVHTSNKLILTLSLWKTSTLTGLCRSDLRSKITIYRALLLRNTCWNECIKEVRHHTCTPTSELKLVFRSRENICIRKTWHSCVHTYFPWDWEQCAHFNLTSNSKPCHTQTKNEKLFSTELKINNTHWKTKSYNSTLVTTPSDNWFESLGLWQIYTWAYRVSLHYSTCLF